MKEPLVVRLQEAAAVPDAIEPVLRDHADRSADPGADGKALWHSFSERIRHGRTCKQWLLDVLLTTSGGRCAYCEAGEPTTVEHFWPKHDYPEKAFVLRNLMPVCVKCNGEKSNEFPLDDAGHPVLLDLYSAAEDPVSFFAYTRDGGIGPLQTGPPGARAREVSRIVNLTRQWIADRRRETWALLTGCCQVYQQNPTQETAALMAAILTEGHRGTMRYLVNHAPEVGRVVSRAAREDPCVRAVIEAPPYAWPAGAGGSSP